MKVLLFDIDGTLLDADGIGGHSFELALGELLEREVRFHSHAWLGATDGMVITEILTDEGFPPEVITQVIPKLYARYLDILRETCLAEAHRFKACPGIPDLLKELSKRSDRVNLGLVTGNLKDAAHIKLSTLGLDKYFHNCIGGFAEDHNDRSELLAITLKRVRQRFPDCPDENILIIGDSHRDIEAAKANGLPSVAVATGKLELCELAAYQPTHLFRDFSNLDEALEVLG